MIVFLIDASQWYAEREMDFSRHLSFTETLFSRVQRARSATAAILRARKRKNTFVSWQMAPDWRAVKRAEQEEERKNAQLADGRPVGRRGEKKRAVITTLRLGRPPQQPPPRTDEPSCTHDTVKLLRQKQLLHSRTIRTPLLKQHGEQTDASFRSFPFPRPLSPLLPLFSLLFFAPCVIAASKVVTCHPTWRPRSSCSLLPPAVLRFLIKDSFINPHVEQLRISNTQAQIKLYQTVIPKGRALSI